VNHLRTIIEVEKVYVSHLQGCRCRRCGPFAHKDGGRAGVSYLLTRMEVEKV
jgi:hypothetical protein